MTPERWARLRDLFDQALDVDAGERLRFANGVCAGDADLQQSLVKLLLHHQTSAPGVTGRTLSAEHFAEIVGNELRAFHPGEIVAHRFRVERFLAEGGMGEIYVAGDLELNERVALKTIRTELGSDEAVLAAFKREIQLARKITHRNVSRVFDLFRHEAESHGERHTIVFLSMEFLEGETLTARIQRSGALNRVDAQSIATQLIAGLDAAHRAGIIHRDFKSRNVVLVSESDDGRVRSERAVIMDFGLAATLTNAANRIGSDTLVGTPAYMAPEQVEGGPITTATDIYALGVVLFEMASGSLPFRGSSALETARLRLREDPPALRSVAPSVSPSWDRTVRACLQRDVANRPASVQEVEQSLSGRSERRRQLQAAALGVAAAILLAGSWYWMQLPYRPNPAALAAADSARVKAQNITRAGILDAVADYRRAIALDPRWAQPWAELAYAYAAGANAQYIQGASARTEARAAALRAIQLDQRSAKAFGVLGWVQSLDFDEWPQAEGNLRRAIVLDPNDAQLRSWLGVHLRKKGRYADAEIEDRQALTLSRRAEPFYWCELAFLYWTSAQLDRMDQLMQELLVAYPNFGLTRFLNARLLKERGQFDAALSELVFSERLQYAAVTVLAERASIEAYRGDVTGARAHLRELTEMSEKQPVDTLLIAGVYAKIGDFDAAFGWLERGYQQRDNTLLSVATSPVLKPLRGDPRFGSLLERLHFTP